MGKIVAIGGGEIDRPEHTAETTEIDKRILELTGKDHPCFLFIPTASSDSDKYLARVKKHFGETLGCKVEVLLLFNEKINKTTLRNKILNADIVYVGGGNTLKMINIWKKLGIDEILKEAYEKDIVLSGISAGSICWFRKGSSDSRKFINPEAKLIEVTGLGLIDAVNCPHYDVESDRKDHLKKIAKNNPGVCVAMDDCCALEIVDDKYRVICTKPSANVYRTYWKDNQYFEEVLDKTIQMKPLNDLLST